MGLRINTNIMALQAQRHLREHTRRAQKAMERLSSGLRINRAGDDPAGLAISEGLKARIRALDVAGRNAADGISMVQVAEGGLDSVSELLIRMKELGVQALNGAMDDQQRSYLDREFQALKEEITRIAGASEFNGLHLLDGSQGSVDLQVGVDAGGSGALTVALGIDASAAGLGIDGLDVLFGTDASAGAAVAGIDAALATGSAATGPGWGPPRTASNPSSASTPTRPRTCRRPTAASGTWTWPWRWPN